MTRVAWIAAGVESRLSVAGRALATAEEWCNALRLLHLRELVRKTVNSAFAVRAARRNKLAAPSRHQARAK